MITPDRKRLTLTDNYKFKHSSKILTRANRDGSISMINIDADKNFYTIDGIAANVWQLLNGKNTLKNISLKMSVKYDVEPEIVGRDIVDLVKKLLALKLIC